MVKKPHYLYEEEISKFMNDPSMEFSGDSDSDKTLNYWSSSASYESSDSDLKKNNVNPLILRRDTAYECKLCKVGLCIDQCFEIFLNGFEVLIITIFLKYFKMLNVNIYFSLYFYILHQ
jgi:hypothetical protein